MRTFDGIVRMPYTVWSNPSGRTDIATWKAPIIDEAAGTVTFPADPSRRGSKPVVFTIHSFIGFREDGMAETARIEFRDERGRSYLEGLAVTAL